MHYFISGIGGCLTGMGLASGNSTNIICGSIYICTAIILVGIKNIRR